MNEPTREDGLCPIHYAAFNGNPKIIKVLIQNGADINARSKSGLSVMHVAAQGDRPYPLTLFKSLGLSINDRDYKNSTPLHWCFLNGCDFAAYYLLSWQPEIDVNP